MRSWRSFSPLLAGDGYVAQAVAAAEDLLRATGHADPAGPWVPVGVGVHAGLAWFGVVGEGRHVEFTSVGDTANIAARLAAQAQAGEVLVSASAGAASGLGPGPRPSNARTQRQGGGSGGRFHPGRVD